MTNNFIHDIEDINETFEMFYKRLCDLFWSFLHKDHPAISLFCELHTTIVMSVAAISNDIVKHLPYLQQKFKKISSDLSTSTELIHQFSTEFKNYVEHVNTFSFNFDEQFSTYGATDFSSITRQYSNMIKDYNKLPNIDEIGIRVSNLWAWFASVGKEFNSCFDESEEF